MKLKSEDKRKLRELGHVYIKSVENLSKNHFTFDAVVEAMKSLKNDILPAMMVVMKPYLEKMSEVANDMSRTSDLNFIKKLYLKGELSDLQRLLQRFSGEVFTKELQQRQTALFTGAPISNLNVNEKNNVETKSTRDQLGLFRSVTQRTHTLDCTVKFTNGSTLTWHTLDAGPELEQARAAYNENLRPLGHIEIPRMAS